MRFQGKIDRWDDARGFGFIAPREGGDRVFVHVSAFPPAGRRPSEGEFVSYALGADERGRARAVSVTYVVGATRPSATRPRTRSGFAVACCVVALFALVLTAAIVAGGVPWPAAPVYVVASLVAYGLYAHDKRAATAGAWRVKESTLHLAGVLCGWPGALLAQQWLRHKTSKTEFQIIYWITVAANVGATVYVGRLLGP